MCAYIRTISCLYSWKNAHDVNYYLLLPLQTLTWTLQTSLSGSESLEIEVYDYEKLRPNRSVVSTLVNIHECVHTARTCACRLLGSLSVSLQEVVSKGSQNISSPLKSKKGEIMQVCVCVYVCV